MAYPGWPAYLRGVKKAILTAVLYALLAGTSAAQTFILAGNGHIYDTPVLRIEGDRCMPPYSYDWSEAYYTVTKNMITEGNSRWEFDPVYTVIDNKVYAGNAMYTSQIKYTFENGVLYRRNSTFRLDALLSVHDNIIYKGAESFPSDAVYMIQGPYTSAQLIAALLALGLIS